jgi:hypothetical protein
MLKKSTMKKILLFLLVALSTTTSFAQTSTKKVNFGLYYVASIPTSPYGFGYSISGKKFGFYNNFTFGKPTYMGTQHFGVRYNEGIYQIGDIWGNSTTGVTDQYIENTSTTITAGITYKLYETKNGLGIKPYLGIGISKYTSIENNYIEAEDVSSGMNVLGYYWLYGPCVEYTATKTNISAGVFITKNMFQVGIGYET